MTRLPDFVIVGAYRAGTTSLARYMGSHPQVFMAAQKEVHYFDTEYQRGKSWYSGHFSQAEEEQLCGEATPAYFAHEVSRQRMAETIPNAKFVVSVREPVDRIWSQYWMRRERGLESRDFQDAIESELRSFTWDGLKTLDSGSSHYLTNSLYAFHLQQFDRLFGRDSTHVVVFESMKSDPAKEYAKVCRFLGIDDTYRTDQLGAQINPYVSFRSLRIRNWTRSGDQTLMKRFVARLNVKSGVSYPSLDVELRKELNDFFAVQVQELEERLGRHLNEWSPRDTE